MKRSIPDTATDKIIKMREMVKGKLSEEYKGTRPYRQDPIPPREQLYQYSQITPEVFMSLRQSLGDDNVNEFVMKMEKLKERYIPQQEAG